jgi:hypothetical protein
MSYRWPVSGKWHSVMIYGLLAREEKEYDRYSIPVRFIT